jgi:hypothetical protein
MLEFIPYLLIALLTANTTVQLPVPIQVEVGGGTNHNASPIPLDAATITGLVGIGSAFVYRWKQSDKRQKVGAQTDLAVANSLKQTDRGVADTLCKIGQAIEQIPGVPEEAKKLIKGEMDAWNKDNEQYYDKTSPNPETDMSKDPVVQVMGQVQKQTEKTED